MFCVVSIGNNCYLYLAMSEYNNKIRRFNFPDDPIGDVVFTATGTNIINIEVDNGTDMGKYTEFIVRRDGQDICTIPFVSPLNDCFDQGVKPGENDYSISAKNSAFSSNPKTFTAAPLNRNRNYCNFSNCNSAGLKLHLSTSDSSDGSSYFEITTRNNNYSWFHS